MAEVEAKFETKEVQVVKGFEGKTRTKWESQGWEFVQQEKGSIRTKLTFRRPKPKANGGLIAGLGALAVSLIGFSLFMGSIEGDNPETTPKSPTATASEIPPSDPDASSTPEILTVENSRELAELLSSSGEDLEMNQAFFDNYNGALIEFNANIAFMAEHGDYETRFDVLIYPDDYSETTVIGPPFRVLDVNYYDFNLIGPDAPDSIMMGMNVRIVGKIVDWDDPSFTLEIISTKVR